MKHPYWGNIEQDWAGFSGTKTFSHPFFGNEEVTIFLGEEYDEEGEEIDEAPSPLELSDLAVTFQHFSDNMDAMLALLQHKAFERYLKLYAHYYEDSNQSGEPPLNIDTVEKHNPHLQDLKYIRVTEGNTIRLSLDYSLDTEHGLEFKFINNNLEKVGGIADT